MEIKEKIIIDNSFGTVTNKRVIYNKKTGSINEITTKQIYSISFRIKHNIIGASVYFIFCIILLIALFVIESSNEFFKNTPSLVIIAFIIVITLFFLISMFQYIGHYIIRINEVGEDRILMKVKLSETKEGREFMESIEKQLSLKTS